MKIERINENSIKCTLTSFDLSIRNMNIRELAYGTEKAKKLFDEMRTKAGDEVGFHVENAPIMIEAIPLGGDSIQLIISKVEDPEELDTRFSKFSKAPVSRKDGEDWLSKLTSGLLEGAEGLISQLSKLGDEKNADGQAAGSNAKSAQPQAEAKEVETGIDFRAFLFDDLNRVIEASRTAYDFPGDSTLYKKPDNRHYVLVLEGAGCKPEEFSRACNTIAEYGRTIKTVAGTLAYYDEHYKVISRKQAIRKLGQL